MKNILSILMLLMVISFTKAQITTDPSPPEANQAVVINFDKTGTGLANYSGDIYVHTGVTIDGKQWENVIGSWGNNTTQPKLNFVSGSTYKLEIPTSIYQFY